MTDPHFKYLCDKKRGLSKDTLLQDILASYLELYRKGWVNTDIHTEAQVNEHEIIELLIVTKIRNV